MTADTVAASASTERTVELGAAIRAKNPVAVCPVVGGSPRAIRRADKSQDRMRPATRMGGDAPLHTPLRGTEDAMLVLQEPLPVTQAQSRPARLPPARRLGPLGIAALGVAALLTGPPPALASTVVVPDDSSTVTSAIASGADTVLVREGTYLETPRVERDLVLRGIGVSRPRLNGLALTNLYTCTTGTIVSGIDVSGTVGYTQVRDKSDISISISDCSMDGGIQLNAFNYNCGLSLVRCRLPHAAGDVGGIFMEADTLDGGVSWTVWSRISVSIQHCWFRGALPGARNGAAVKLSYEPDGPVSHNRIENYGIGISAPDAEGSLTLEGNTISGCGTGMQLYGEEGFCPDGE